MTRTFLSILVALSLISSFDSTVNGQSGSSVLRAATAASRKVKAVQTNSTPDPATEKARRSVRRIGLANRITVVLSSGDDIHGTVSRIGPNEFEIVEVDLQRSFTILYKDVKKIRSGYGGINPLTGQRIGPPRSLRIAAILGGLFVAFGLPLILVATQTR